MIVLMLCACTLPLFAVDQEQYLRGSHYRGYLGHIVCELVVRHGMLAPHELIRFPCISKHIHVEASKKLNEHRLVLKNFIEKKYPTTYCEITYSQNQLEAAIIEKTRMQSADGIEDDFQYVYLNDSQGTIENRHATYARSKRCTNYQPFFTTTHVCLDFGIDTTLPEKSIFTPTGLCWNRKTKHCGATKLLVDCQGHYVPTGYLVRVLPILYKKIIEKAQHFEINNNIFLQEKRGAYRHTRPVFVINLTRAAILSKEDVKTLGTFLPGGKYGGDKNWFVSVKNGINAYHLLNILVCYSTPEIILNILDYQVGRKKGIWRENDVVLASQCRDIIDLFQADSQKKTFHNVSNNLSIMDQASLHYIAHLKNEGVFVEKDWHDKTANYKIYNKAIRFLQIERISCVVHDKWHLIRHDRLSNAVAIFKCVLGLHKIIEETVPVNINVHSIKIRPAITEKFVVKKYAMDYQLYNPIFDTNSESSDILVESSSSDE